MVWSNVSSPTDRNGGIDPNPKFVSLDTGHRLARSSIYIPQSGKWVPGQHHLYRSINGIDSLRRMQPASSSDLQGLTLRSTF